MGSYTVNKQLTEPFMQKQYLLILSLWLGGLFSLSAQTTVSLSPAKDNTLYESNDGTLSNGSGRYLFVGNTNNGAARRALLQFDLGEIPAEATITEVELVMTMNKSAAGAMDLSLHLLTKDWGEGSSEAGGQQGGGGAPTTDDATWIHNFFDTSTWDNAGGDFVAEPSATQSVSGSGPYGWTSDELLADVQGWYADPGSNFGWIMIGNEAQNQTAKRFYSREEGTEADRPILNVTYEVATALPANPLASQVRVQPLPDQQMVRVQNLDAANTLQVDLLNLSGQIVARASLQGRAQATLPLAQLPRGVYVLRVRGQAGQWLRKIWH